CHPFDKENKSGSQCLCDRKGFRRFVPSHCRGGEKYPGEPFGKNDYIDEEGVCRSGLGYKNTISSMTWLPNLSAISWSTLDLFIINSFFSGAELNLTCSFLSFTVISEVRLATVFPMISPHAPMTFLSLKR